MKRTRGFKKLTKNAFIPQRINDNAAGYDLQALHTVKFKPHEYKIVKTGVTTYMKRHEVGIVANRSSNPVKRGLVLLNGIGVIDSDYTGDVGVELMNIKDEPNMVKRGQKIAQIMFFPFLMTDTDRPVTDVKRKNVGFGGHFWNNKEQDK